MSNLILTTDFVEKLGALFAEDFTHRGSDEHVINDSKGLFIQCFMDVTKADYFDDDCEYITVDEDKTIGFFTPESHYEVVKAEDLKAGDCVIRGEPGNHRIVKITCRADHVYYVSFMFDGEPEQTFERTRTLWKV